ncbi:Hypothetical predicted protein [Olea europaea subsp. europaea]|uniref:Uncharacterized protein n=1 Tax=Olea europaea subsp. europaea TaxID=158383 RepID=A0A8S0S076_OLEEU|nr:Hypothetical predicted protein [Olea europaea subsp. europaea]
MVRAAATFTDFVVKSANSILEEQEDWGNYDLKLHVDSNTYGNIAFRGNSYPEVTKIMKTMNRLLPRGFL